uniref:Cytochrome P450 n=1 Tax=Oryza punctata TaxID=4537 RepID=A0A0E0LNS8_ORYPU
MGFAWMVAAAAMAAAVSWAFSAVVQLVWRRRAITRLLRAQGVGGPEYRFFTGNLGEIMRIRGEGDGVVLDVSSHDILNIVQPYLRKWIPLYGRTILFWLGGQPNMYLADLNMVRQVLSDRTGMYSKDIANLDLARLLGKGLVLIDGDEWKRHRKVVHPAFDMDKLKLMTVKMSDCAQSMISEWESELGTRSNAMEIELSRWFDELTADVISHTAFGSSYREGKQVFLAQKELRCLALSTFYTIRIPGFNYIPTKKNLKTWSLDEKVRIMLMDIIKSRQANKDTMGYGNDLLGLMLEACASEHNENQPRLSMDEIIAECKTFFFAGHETTSHLLTWTMFLLSTHPEWQEKLREEVMMECGDEVPTGDMLSKLKLVNIFLLETLRLYSPISVIMRRADADLKLGNIKVPEGTILRIPIATIHRDKEVWGEDADKFRPERFKNGVSKAAKHPNALLSFSSGPRSCIGQNFAMLEAKVVIALILQRFSFTLSPKYVHAPTSFITLRPKYGLPMILRSLKTRRTNLFDPVAMGNFAWMVAAAVTSWAFNAVVKLVWRPRAITRQLRAQGIGGPEYRFFCGNLGEIKQLRAEGANLVLDISSHDFVPIVQPQIRKWVSLYGRMFLFWFGAHPNVCLTDINMVRQVLSDRTGMYPKDITNTYLAHLLGKGLVLTDGDE